MDGEYANKAHFEKWYKKAFMAILDFMLLNSFFVWNTSVAKPQWPRGRRSRVRDLEVTNFGAKVKDDGAMFRPAASSSLATIPRLCCSRRETDDEWIPSTNGVPVKSFRTCHTTFVASKASNFNEKSTSVLVAIEILGAQLKLLVFRTALRNVERSRWRKWIHFECSRQHNASKL